MANDNIKDTPFDPGVTEKASVKKKVPQDKFKDLKDELFNPTPTEKVKFVEPSVQIVTQEKEPSFEDIPTKEKIVEKEEGKGFFASLADLIPGKDVFMPAPAFTPERDVIDNTNKATFADNLFFQTFMYMLDSPSLEKPNVIDPEKEEHKELVEIYKKNKGEALNRLVKDLESMHPFEKAQMAGVLAVSKSLTFGAAPELQQQFDVQSEVISGYDAQGKPIKQEFTVGEQFNQLFENPEKATYLVSGMAADIFRDLGLAALTGGGYKAYIGWQSLNSSIGMYNEVSENLRVNPNSAQDNALNVRPENAPATFAVINGAANLGVGAVAPWITKSILNKWATDKVLNKAIFHAMVNTVENSAQNVIEQSIMNTAMRGEVGVNWFAASLAGIMGFGSGYAMSKYGMKMPEVPEPKAIPQKATPEVEAFTKTFIGDVATFEDNKMINKMNQAILGTQRPIKDTMGDSVLNFVRETQKLGKDIGVELQKKMMSKGDIPDDMLAVNPLGTVSGGGDLPPAKPQPWKYGQNLTSKEIAVLNAEMFKEVKAAFERDGVVDPNVQRMVDSVAITGEKQQLLNDFFKKDVKQMQDEIHFKARESVKKDFANKLRSENPDITDKAIGDQFKKIDNNVEEMWHQFVMNVKEDFPAGSVQDKMTYLHRKLDNLNIQDLTLEGNMADLLFKNINEGVLDVNATVKDLQIRIKEVSNFKLYDGLTTKVNRLLEASGMKEKLPGAIDLSEGKKYLSEDIYNKKIHGVFNLYDRYKQAYAKKTPDFFDADNIWFEDAQTMRLNLSRAAFSATDPILFDAYSKAYYNLATMGPGNGKMRSKLNKWFDEFVEFTENLDNNKIRTYMDVLDNDIRLAKEIEFEKRNLLGNKDVLVHKSLAENLKMTDEEIVAANKLANINETLNNLRLLNESKVPQDFAKLIDNIPEFQGTEAQFKGTMYHGVEWSDDGKAQIRATNKDIKIQEEIHPSVYKPRGYNLEMRSKTEFRLDPLDETKKHFDNMAQTLFNKSVYKSFEDIAYKMFDSAELKKHSSKNNGQVDLKRLFEANSKDNSAAKRMARVMQQFENITKPVSAANKVEIAAGNVMGPIVNAVTRSLLSSGKLAFHLLNVGQVSGTLTPYLGVKNVIKNVPEGYGTFIKFFTKNKANISKSIVDILEGAKAKNTPESIRFAERLDYYVKHFMDLEQVKTHYSFRGEDRAFKIPFTKSKFLRDRPKLKNALETAERYLFDAMTASDFSSRVWGTKATLDFLDDVYKKNNWTPKDASHAIKKISKMEEDLNLMGMGPIAYKEISDALHKGLQTGDMADFENKYIFHTLDSGLFHYDIANRHMLYDKARARGKLTQLATRFTSWTMYDIELHRRMISDFAQGRASGAMVMRVLGLVALGFGAKIAHGEWWKENSDTGKAVKKHFYDRMYGARLIDGITGRIDKPWGILESTYVQLKKMVKKGREGEFYYPSFAPQSPISADDVKRAYKNVRDMIYKEGDDNDKEHIDEIGRGLFDMLDNPEKEQ